MVGVREAERVAAGPGADWRTGDADPWGPERQGSPAKSFQSVGPTSRLALAGDHGEVISTKRPATPLPLLPFERRKGEGSRGLLNRGERGYWKSRLAGD